MIAANQNTIVDERGYLIYDSYTIVDKPLWWHKLGLSQTASGYGSKLVSSRMVQIHGEKIQRRIYVTCYSNCGTAWINYKGNKVYLRG